MRALVISRSRKNRTDPISNVPSKAGEVHLTEACRQHEPRDHFEASSRVAPGIAYPSRQAFKWLSLRPVPELDDSSHGRAMRRNPTLLSNILDVRNRDRSK